MNIIPYIASLRTVIIISVNFFSDDYTAYVLLGLNSTAYYFGCFSLCGFYLYALNYSIQAHFEKKLIPTTILSRT